MIVVGLIGYRERIMSSRSRGRFSTYEGRSINNGVFTRSSKLPANVLKIYVLMLDVAGSCKHLISYKTVSFR